MLATISSLDISIVHTVQSIGPAWIGAANLLSDIIGSTIYLAPAVILALLAIGKRRTALEVFIIFIVSGLVVYGLKHLITADRPYWVDPSIFGYAVEDGYGMPSGHALISLVTLGWLWMRHPHSHSLSMGIPAILVLIGLSRIYLGVHYPSQVIIGWFIGIILLIIFWWMDRKFFRKRDRFVRSSAKLR
jgi:membrane-associated phospholipid phosphatase